MKKRYVGLVKPRTNVTDTPGMCLRYVQKVFGAPAQHRSAWHAWKAQKHRHGPDEPLPNVPVVLWFAHWGNYDDGLGPYDDGEGGNNWGHTTALVPGDAIYSSPADPRAGASYDRYQSYQQVERAFNARYVGWSEDLNGLRIAKPATAPAGQKEEEDDMPKNQAAWTRNGKKQINRVFNTGSGFDHEWESSDGAYNTNILRTFDANGTLNSELTLSQYAALTEDLAAVRAQRA